MEPPAEQPRARLLDAAVGYAREHGLGDVSLRELAAAIGTSHRMLIYYFGSKEGLLAAVVQAVEAEQREFLAGLAADPAIGPVEAMRAMWRRIADPGLWPSERLFFEVYGQALQGRPHTTDLLDGIVDDWLDPITEINMSLGLPRAAARAHARLGVAVTRGLLLDLLATGDQAGVDDAMDAFIDVYEAWLNALAGG